MESERNPPGNKWQGKKGKVMKRRKVKMWELYQRGTRKERIRGRNRKPIRRTKKAGK